MKTSDTLYAAADYIRENGFSVHMYDGCAACMAGAINTITGDMDADEKDRFVSASFLEPLGMEWRDLYAAFLQYHGWTKRDAIAALEIAADIACAEGN